MDTTAQQPAATIRSLSDVLEDFKNTLTGEQVTLDHILLAFHERGIGILLLLFAAPMALPVPVPPGINIALATPLLLLTAQQALGAHTVWLPKKMRARSFTVERLQKLLSGIIPLLRKIEFFTRPRLGWITRGPVSRFFGALGVIMALSVCIPLPLTNTLPSLGIALMAIGIGMRDGLAVICGAVIGISWIAILSFALLTFGPEGFEILKSAIKSLIM